MKATKKPWGKEYLLYQNDDVAIWHLFIEPGQSTSLHCHPNKKTGLVVLDGAAQVSFLGGGGEKLFPGEKVMIRQGVFHQSTSKNNSVLQLLEIETPVDKADIVRLKDRYGRAGEAYNPDEVLNVEPLELSEDGCKSGCCDIKFGDLKSYIDYSRYDCFMITEGQITFNDFQVAGPGDILSIKNLDHLIGQFEHKKLKGLLIKSCI
jgi:mannose-6-phosphate isomerase-like protein (cupin superfamily)